MIKINRPPCPALERLEGNYKYPENKKALQIASYEKCMYCESKITHVYFGDVEHIKPKSIFPEDEFNWENLGFVCAKCNNAKGDKYHAECPYIDPYQEDPSNFFIARDCLIAERRGDERAEITKMDIDLNRAGLVERRKERLDAIQKFVSNAFSKNNQTLKNFAIRELKKEALPNSEYSFFVRSLLERHGI